MRAKIKSVGATTDGSETSAEQGELWRKYKILRNRINNRIKKEEILYKKSKVAECQDCPSKT